MKKSKIIFAGIVALILIVLFYFVFVLNDLLNPGQKGVKAVKLLYQFNTLEDLVDNTERFKKMSTNEVYQYATYENIDKSLHTYLKDRKESSSIEVLDKRPGMVVYTINSPHISYGRQFMFIYELNALGKISYVREVEIKDFYE